MKPEFIDFMNALREAIVEVLEGDDEHKDTALAAFDRLGHKFDLVIDGDIDSLDRLDVVFAVDKKLDIHIDIESLAEKNQPITAGNLYNVIADR